MSILDIDIQETNQYAEQTLKVDDLIGRIVNDIAPYVVSHYSPMATVDMFAIIHFRHHHDIGCMIADWRITPLSFSDLFAKDSIRDIIKNKITLENKVCKIHPADYTDISSIQFFSNTGKNDNGYPTYNHQIAWRSV